MEKVRENARSAVDRDGSDVAGPVDVYETILDGDGPATGVLLRRPGDLLTGACSDHNDPVGAAAHIREQGYGCAEY